LYGRQAAPSKGGTSARKLPDLRWQGLIRIIRCAGVDARNSLSRKGFALAKQVPRQLKGFDPFGDLVGLTFTKWEEGYSRCVMEVEDRLLNPHRTLHGGATYTMSDSGMGATLYSVLDEDELCATIEIKIVYFKAVGSGTLTCDTKLIHRGKTIATLESEIRNGQDLVAKAMGTWSIFKDRKR